MSPSRPAGPCNNVQRRRAGGHRQRPRGTDPPLSPRRNGRSTETPWAHRYSPAGSCGSQVMKTRIPVRPRPDQRSGGVRKGPRRLPHFSTPGAGDGRLFAANARQVTAFTIAATPPPSPTTTVLSSSSDPSSAGQAVTFTAQVSPAPDSGTVGFTDGGTVIAGCAAVAWAKPAVRRAAGRATAGRGTLHRGRLFRVTGTTPAPSHGRSPSSSPERRRSSSHSSSASPSRSSISRMGCGVRAAGPRSSAVLRSGPARPSGPDSPSRSTGLPG